ncbi:hypothetical protein BpHYR1_000143 [Brachionus plicatilis]|uniref:Uncharacterized protein n=1 Tax=Brachionus plicatilis TaxID=10195 RepID=A0A3M7SDK8_BRAPC|nr:hypothetical protein BpHYR1_000143 [Brachionus plicatilis]
MEKNRASKLLDNMALRGTFCFRITIAKIQFAKFIMDKLFSFLSFNLAHIVPFFKVIYYLSLHLRHISFKVDLIFPFLLQNHNQIELGINSIISHVFDLFYEIKDNFFGGSKKPSSGLT